ncbi:hypothetical protein [uncultured Pseudokineococcus sp.]|uniref:hypothetical protein n=1 Tax=uncultured Pseudokineococcus sp. TaxID=1642928 RepID=UPI00260F8FB0|nr:hypothetical protein [uncultured Pseudokineococcus sp.]
MSAAQLALLAGAVAAFGLFLLVREVAVPRQADLTDAMSRLRPTGAGTTTGADLSGGGIQSRLGGLLHRRIGTGPTWLQVPVRDLALLQVPLHAFYGQKILLGIFGLVTPALLGIATTVISGSAAFALPAVFGVFLAVALFMAPDILARQQAAASREDFSRAVGAYLELVALERVGGNSVTGSMTAAAQVAQAAPFRRIREELLRARLAGQTPWKGLASLSEELGVPELADVADIMRLAGEDSAAVYDSLRARARSLRLAMLTAEHGRAGAATARTVIPNTVLLFPYIVMLLLPALLSV